MRVAVIGAGYVGLTTAVCLAEIGHDVIIAEQNNERKQLIETGVPSFFEPLLNDLLRRALSTSKLSVVSTVAEAVPTSEITIVAVGTPFKDNKIDLTYIEEACAAIGKVLAGVKDYHVVAIKSTVIPGTTDTTARKQLEQHSGLTAPQFGLCMNPEFLREGSAIYDFRNPDRIIIGAFDERAGQTLAKLYEGFSCPVLFTGLRDAELTKYASNALLSLLVSFSNELAALCEAFPGNDIDVVMDGLHLDKRLSPIVDGKRVTPEILKYLRAGCGFGGSCLPKDVNALRGFADSLGVETPLLDATIAVNQFRTEQVIRILGDTIGSFKGKEVAVLGLAFKPNTDDIRESPSLKLIDSLLKKGCRVRVFDPMVSGDFLVSEHVNVTSGDSVEQASKGADAIIVATAWPEFKTVDWQQVVSSMKRAVIIDGRRLLASVPLPPDVVYRPIGSFHPQSESKSLGGGL